MIFFFQVFWCQVLRYCVTSLIHGWASVYHTCSTGEAWAQDLRVVSLVFGGVGELWVTRWGLHGYDLFRHVPRMLNQIGIWGILHQFLECHTAQCPAGGPRPLWSGWCCHERVYMYCTSTSWYESQHNISVAGRSMVYTLPVSGCNVVADYCLYCTGGYLWLWSNCMILWRGNAFLLCFMNDSWACLKCLK